MERKLRAALQPTRLELIDESALHAGHAHAGVESHFRLTVESAAFLGLDRLARQRLVMRIVAEELAGPVHALSIRALTPGEDQT
ncbi:MAG TPA: BolA family protein [Caulobacteraceae bacterium]|nr:BolA family protein [Caulobacteraceae bacterium]